MKTITTTAIFALSIIATPLFAQQAGNQNDDKNTAKTTARIEQVQLKNGPLADFYELVSTRSAINEDMAQNKAQTRDKHELTSAKLKKAESEKLANAGKELDKLPQHSAK